MNVNDLSRQTRHDILNSELKQNLFETIRVAATAEGAQVVLDSLHGAEVHENEFWLMAGSPFLGEFKSVQGLDEGVIRDFNGYPFTEVQAAFHDPQGKLAELLRLTWYSSRYIEASQPLGEVGHFIKAYYNRWTLNERQHQVSIDFLNGVTGEQIGQEAPQLPIEYFPPELSATRPAEHQDYRDALGLLHNLPKFCDFQMGSDYLEKDRAEELLRVLRETAVAIENL